MNRLAIPAALAAGEACGFVCFWFGPAWIAAAALSLAVVFFGHGFGLRGWKIAAVFLLGLSLALRSSETRQEAVRDACAPGAPFERRFVVESDPVVKGGKTDRWVSFDSSFSGVDVKIIFPLAGDARLPRVGETWRCAGWLDRKDANDFSRRRMWVRGKGTYAVLDESVGMNQVMAAAAAVRRDLSRRLGTGLESSPETADLNRAILLGERSRLGRDTRSVFVDAGTMHIFAVSGMHVVIVARLVFIILLACFVPYRIACIAALPAIWLYVAVVGAGPSAVRAAAMASACLAAPVGWRRPDALSAWAATFVVFHLVSPQNIVRVSSLLSFAVMLGIVLFIEWSRGLCPKWLEFAGVSFAAWAAGTPVVAHAFGTVTPGGLLANLVLVPAAGFSVCASVLGAAASFISTNLAAHLNNAAALFTRSMVGVSWIVSRLPFAHFRIREWTLLDSVAWYSTMGLAMWLVRSVVLRRRASV